jgi:hypothetical protein
MGFDCAMGKSCPTKGAGKRGRHTTRRSRSTFLKENLVCTACRTVYCCAACKDAHRVRADATCPGPSDSDPTPENVLDQIEAAKAAKAAERRAKKVDIGIGWSGCAAKAD